jgi:hypothetical protein
MRKHLFILFIGLLWSQLAMAQADIVVQSVTGKVVYYAPQESKAQNVYPGMRLSSNGKIRCQSGATIKLLRNGEIFLVKGSKQFALRELDQKSKGGSNVGFMGRFSKFLSGSMKETQNDKELEANHRRYMEKARAGIDGFGSKDFPIQTSLLYSGTLSTPYMEFRWSGAAVGEDNRFQLKRKTDGLVVLTALMRDTSIWLNLAQLALEAGAAYEWQLVDEKTGGGKSAKTAFIYQPNASDQVLAELRGEKDYKEAGPAEQALMEAFSLEEAGFFYDAALIYTAAAKRYAGNLLVRDTQAAFLSRMGLLEAAKALLKR